MRVYEVLLLLCFSIASALAAFNFNNYPECAQSLCYELAPPSCDYGSDTDAEAEQTDSCLCTNTGFISDLAGQIFKTCGCQILTTSAEVFNDNCAKYQTTSVVSVEDFISLGDGGHTSCDSTGLDAGTIAGIVIGLGFWVFCQTGMSLGLTSRDFFATAVVAASGDILTARGQYLYQHIVRSSYEEEVPEAYVRY